MSITNTLKEVTFAVQSTKFINGCDSFSKLASIRGDSDLFTMTENAPFVALSNLVKSDETTLNVNWSSVGGRGTDVKGWMFEHANCSDEKMLKAFIRTQIYRPLFFQYNSYKNFTSNPEAYYCVTEKHFIDHVGNEHKVLFDNWPTDDKLNKDGIKNELESDEIAHGEYTVSKESINYFPISNKFEYSISYNPVQIVDNKFVINDVEYYVVRPDGGENTYINSIYFNEFQSNTEGQNQVAKVTNNKFTLNGLEYVIEGNEISIPSVTQVFDETIDASTAYKGKYKEWKCDIVDGRFQFDGIWYVLVKDEARGNYASVEYADNKDNNLIELLVTTDGVAEYKPWELKFQFETTGTNAWKIVRVVKKHQSDVIDQLTKEWCEFDGPIDRPSEYEFTPNKTYDWYVANELLKIHQQHPIEYRKLLNLGSGKLFNGALKLITSTVPPRDCILHVRNELQNEDVVTVCELVKKYDDNEQIQFMGLLFDRDMKLDSSRMFRGDLTGNIAIEGSSGRFAFFVKELGSGLNNVNTAWTDYSIWNASHQIVQNVAEAQIDEETNQIGFYWDANPNYAETSKVILTPIYRLDDEGNETSTIIKYNVEIDNGLKQYTVWINGQYVHFIVNENRYRLNLSTNKVDRLVINDIQVQTVDFSTSYNPEQLKDNLAQNVKNAMLNQIVQKVIDSEATSSGGEITIQFERPIALYLDMFTDAESLDNYVIANNLEIDSDDCVKFSQVFKNNLVDIDESNMVGGNVYCHLSDNITRTFGINSNILVVDSPSI